MFTRPNVPKVVSYLGTTPEQRAMDTPEFKGKFDEMPEGIQQYIKDTLLVELDAFKQEFIAHQAESASDDVHGLANKVIVESGSNANGRYVRFGDGTQICTRVLPSGTVISGSLNVSNFTFPATFVSSEIYTDKRMFTTVLNPETFDVDQKIGIGCTQTYWNLRRGTGAPETLPAGTMLIAIGKWK